MFEGGKAHVIGVVSRGAQCAGFNQPGIYTNLLHPDWRKWIVENINSGNCS